MDSPRYSSSSSESASGRDGASVNSESRARSNSSRVQEASDGAEERGAWPVTVKQEGDHDQEIVNTAERDEQGKVREGPRKSLSASREAARERGQRRQQDSERKLERAGHRDVSIKRENTTDRLVKEERARDRDKASDRDRARERDRGGV
jgi:hypothetical protein